MSRSKVRYQDRHTRLDLPAEMLVDRPVGYVIFLDQFSPTKDLSREILATRLMNAFQTDGSKVEIVGGLDDVE